MASNSRLIGFTLFKIGLVIALVGVLALFGPKLGNEVAKLLLPDKFKPAVPVKEKVEPAPSTWDPAKEPLPPGMKAVKGAE